MHWLDHELPVGLNICTADVTQFYTSNIFLYGFLTTFVYEFLIYPFVRNRLPSILKRIGTLSLLATLVTFVCFILKLVRYLTHSSETVTEWIVQILHQSTTGVMFQILLNLVLQFMSAQSPYNMRGLLLSLVGTFGIATVGVRLIIIYFLDTDFCTHSWCFLVEFSVKMVLCFIGFLLFCVVARWYKVRVRDDDYSPQRVVEEVYDRYLTAAAAQSRPYGAIN